MRRVALNFPSRGYPSRAAVNRRTPKWCESVCVSGVKRTGAATLALLLIVAAPLAAQPGGWHRQAATQTGAVEFTARVRPSAGRPEPVRELTFYLLRKSLADIQKEVEETEPKPDLDRFIDGLEVSDQLKAWMKKKRSVELAGTGFIRRLKVDDLLDVPEFYEAYTKHNAGDVALGFPLPKYRESDRLQNPQKYEKLHQEYREAIRKWIVSNPQSADGIEVHLDAINPGQRWALQESELRRRIRKRTLDLAQTRYLAAKTDTDLDGRGTFTGLPPGTYWLSTLETEAVAGDSRLRWDTPVTVRAGQTTRLELSNLNALEPQQPTK